MFVGKTVAYPLLFYQQTCTPFSTQSAATRASTWWKTARLEISPIISANCSMCSVTCNTRGFFLDIYLENTNVLGEMAGLSILDNVLKDIENFTKKPENFLSVQNHVARKLEQATKDLYDFTKNETNRDSSALPELVIEDFDEEQIWQQLEIQNDSELTHLLTDVSRVLAGNNKLELPLGLSKPEEHARHEAREAEEIEQVAENESDSDEMDLDIDVKGNLKERNMTKRLKRPSVVDDKFFKLEELDEYLMREDKKEFTKNPEESGESDDESVDLFNHDSSVDEDDDDETKMIKYADFFDNPDYQDHENNSGDNDDNETGRLDQENEYDNDESDKPTTGRNNDHDKRGEKRVKFNLTNDSDDSDSIDNEKHDQASRDTKSTLENKQERLQKRIQELENEAITEKPWQLKGEITGSSRPQNSLLEEFVEFDVTSRPAPVITGQTTITLEDLIKQRIKDQAWDDVEKKFKPVETPLEYKKKLIMDQEKSQKSLAEIYEDAYLKQKEALKPDSDEKEEQEPKEHKEIREMMNSLFSKLDALCNFHYTPKLAQPEIKIISNVPAIRMEEVAPVATSDATMLAPEEVQDKGRGGVIGKSERTKTDMKRARRKKKIKQHAKQKASEEKETTLGDLVEIKKKKLGKNKKNGQDLAIKKLTKDRNISKIDETTQKIPKSSTGFFTQLQDQVTNHIKSKTGKSIKKKDKKTHSAVKLKL